MGKLLTSKQAAEYLGLSPETLNQWRSKLKTTGVQQGPKYVKLAAKAVRYHQDDLDAWVKERKVATQEKQGGRTS